MLRAAYVVEQLHISSAEQFSARKAAETFQSWGQSNTTTDNWLLSCAVQFCAYDWRVMELAVALSK
jgi:hypothetical protein